MDYIYSNHPFSWYFPLINNPAMGLPPCQVPMTSDLQRFAELRRHQDDFLLLLHPQSDEPEMSQATWD